MTAPIINRFGTVLPAQIIAGHYEVFRTNYHRPRLGYSSGHGQLWERIAEQPEPDSERFHRAIAHARIRAVEYDTYPGAEVAKVITGELFSSGVIQARSRVK